MKINVMKYDPQTVSLDELENMYQQLRDDFSSHGEFLLMPTTWEFFEDVSVEQLKGFKDEIERLIEEKENESNA